MLLFVRKMWVKDARDGFWAGRMAVVASQDLGLFVGEYLARVVNRRDLSALDDLVSPGYRGSGNGWPSDIGRLRAFYEWQARWRPDWRIDVQETIEVGDCVAVRAFACGTVSHDDHGSPLTASFRKEVEWLSVYRLADERITEIQFLSVVDRSVT